MLNITEFSQLKTIEEIIVACHQATAVPSLVLGAFVSYLLILVGGLFAFDEKTKFFIFWLIGLVVLGGVFLFISLSPLWVYEISNKLLNFLS